MPHMPDIFHEAEEAVFGRRHVVPLSEGGTDTPDNIVTQAQDAPTARRQWEHAVGHLFHHDADPATQTPATVPATMAATPVAAATQEEPMSIITDLEDGYAAAKADLAKVEAALPGALAKARQLEGNPLADLAVKAAESILPPEAVAIINSTASKVFDELMGLYAPAQATAPVQQVGQPVAPAQ